MTQARTHVDFLKDIWIASETALRFIGEMPFDDFQSDEKTTFAVVRALEIVGEAAKKIPIPQVRDKYPHIPWRSMAGLRDKLIHDYVSVNLEIVGKTATEDLRPLLAELRTIADSESSAAD